MSGSIWIRKHLAAGAALLLLVLLSSLATPGHAAELRVALVIGNAGYKDLPLDNPQNDAADMAAALREMGFRVILKRDADSRGMRNAVREFGAELRNADVGLFYYAGHGVQLGGANYLLPVGADIRTQADAEDVSLDVNYVLRTMEGSQARVRIVILDACRNNPYPRAFRSAALGLAPMTAVTGSVVAFATAPGSLAADGEGRNGMYTKHLLESLRHPESDILKVFQRTRAGVVRETGGRQTPWESTSLVGDFHFRAPQATTQLASAAPAAVATPAADPTATDRAYWESVKDTKNPDELQAYLDQFPNGLFAGLARARMRALDKAPTVAAAATTGREAAPAERERTAPPAATPSGLSYGGVTSQVQKNKTTQLDLVQMFGGPSISTTDADGTEVWVYERAVTETERQNRSEGYQAAANLGLFFSHVQVGGGGTTGKSSSASSTSTSFRSLTVIVKFNPNKTVKEYAVRASQF
jgi:uncharacterized caspase-like protein